MSTVNYVYKIKQTNCPPVNTICSLLFYSLQLLLAHSNNYTDLISSFHVSFSGAISSSKPVISGSYFSAIAFAFSSRYPNTLWSPANRHLFLCEHSRCSDIWNRNRAFARTLGFRKRHSRTGFGWCHSNQFLRLRCLGGMAFL